MFSYGDRTEGQHNHLASEARLIGAVAKWCECLHSKALLMDALHSIAESLGAEIVVLARVPKTARALPKTISYDSKPTTGHGPCRSYSRTLLGPYLDQAKPGSTWAKSTLYDEFDPSLMEFHLNRRLRELIVIPLSRNDMTSDLLELHFPEAVPPQILAVLNILAETLAQTWGNRAKGLFMDALLRSTPNDTAPLDGKPILSVENPARLSRAEYRVCVLLNRGKTNEGILKALAISTSTLRTHLRNIYAKTGVQNQAELIYQLMSVEPFTSDDAVGAQFG